MTESEQIRAARAAVEAGMQERERAIKERERRYANRKRRSNFNGERRVPGYQIWVVSRDTKRHGFLWIHFGRSPASRTGAGTPKSRQSAGHQFWSVASGGRQ